MLTDHAAERMNSRGLPLDAVAAAITYGRVVHIRGADIHAIGWRDVEWWHEHDGIDLARYEGVQVVCSPEGVVLTVYRNRDFSGLRVRQRRRHTQRRAS
jgi:hypothetical protein